MHMLTNQELNIVVHNDVTELLKVCTGRHMLTAKHFFSIPSFLRKTAIIIYYANDEILFYILPGQVTWHHTASSQNQSTLIVSFLPF